VVTSSARVTAALCTRSRTAAWRDQRVSPRTDCSRRRDAVTGTIGAAPVRDGFDGLGFDALEMDRGDSEVAYDRRTLTLTVRRRERPHRPRDRPPE
jgi:hypothetical protein